MSDYRIGLQNVGDRVKDVFPKESVITFAIFIVFWQFATLFYSPRDLPSVFYIIEQTFVVVTGGGEYHFLTHASISIQRIAIASVVSLVIGVLVGIVMGWAKRGRYLTAPVMIVLAFPSVVWAFISVMWFGITTYLVMVLVMVLIVSPYITVNVWKGAESIDENLTEMANAFDAGILLKWRYVLVPSLMPFVFASARLAVSLSWKLSLVAEIFGATSGIGYVINIYFESMRADMIIVWSVPMMLTMFLIERVLNRVEDNYFEWRPDSSSVAKRVR